MTDVEVTYVSSEVELIEKLIQLVRQVDPDFLIGYEITMASWGYLTERAAQLNANLTTELSRMPGELSRIVAAAASSACVITVAGCGLQC